MCAGLIVCGRTLQREFENSIGERSTADEDDPVEETDIVEGRDDVESSRAVLFEVFVFDGEFVVSHSLFALHGGGWRLRSEEKKGEKQFIIIIIIIISNANG